MARSLPHHLLFLFLFLASRATSLSSPPSTVVAWWGTVPSSVTVEELPSALHRIWPDRYATPTAARKACRRREIYYGSNRTAARSRGSCQTVIYHGDVIEHRVRAAPGRIESIPPARLAALQRLLPVVYEDDAIAVVNKPRGMAVHNSGASEHTMPSVRSALLHVLQPTRSRDPAASPSQGDEEGDDEEDSNDGEDSSSSSSSSRKTGDGDVAMAPLRRPLHAHRLDKQTSGLLLVAKTRHALRSLSRSFESREVHKRYRAIVAGDWSSTDSGVGATGHIDEPISGSSALTKWEVVTVTPSGGGGGGGGGGGRAVTTLDLFPCTGRQHQLRRHCAGRGMPIVGDARYGSSGGAGDGTTAGEEEIAELPASEMLLSSVEVSFPHPVTLETLTCVIPEPAEFEVFRVRCGRL